MSDASRQTQWLVGMSLAFVGAFATLYMAAIATELGQSIDAGSLGVLGWLRSEAWLAFYDARDVIAALVLATAGLAALSVALERRFKPVAYSAALIVIVGAAAWALKEFLPRPYFGEFAYAVNTFPSGHAAICLAGSVAIVWCAPRWTSPVLITILGCLSLFVAASSVLSSAHRASDSLGGVLLVGAVACGLAAIANTSAEPLSARRIRILLIAAGGLAITILCLAAIALGLGAAVWNVLLGAAILVGLPSSIALVLAANRPIAEAPSFRSRETRSVDADDAL